MFKSHCLQRLWASSGLLLTQCHSIENETENIKHMKLGKSRYKTSILEYEESYRLTLSLLSFGTLFILMSEQHTYLNIEVEDSEWCPSALHDIVHNLMKSSIIVL